MATSGFHALKNTRIELQDTHSHCLGLHTDNVKMNDKNIVNLSGNSAKTVKVSLLNTPVSPRPISSTVSHFSSLYQNG